MPSSKPAPRINAVAIGGFIEFGERSEDAVVREFKEELDRDVEVVRLLEVSEQFFEFEPDSGPLRGHEITFLYELMFAPHHRPPNFQPLASFEQDAPEGDEHSLAHWLPVSELRADLHPIYPADLMTKLAPLFE